VDPTTLRLEAASDVVARLLDYIAAGLDAHGDTQTVRDLVGRLLQDGTGSSSQRQWSEDLARPKLVRRMTEMTAGSSVSGDEGLQAPR
jgi:hypothetical protein